MSATIGKIDVFLNARTEKFRKGMKKASYRVKRFASSVGAGAKRVALFSAAVTAAAATAVTVMTKRAMDAIDEVGKLSDRINIATEDIIRFRHVGELAGVAVQSMDKSMGMFVRRLGEARQGTGEAVNGLKAIGLTADELVKAGPAEAFKKVADAIALLPNQADKAVVAYQLFGRSGMDMINVLQMGSAAIEEQMKKADDLNLTFSRFDAKKVEEANDAMISLKKALGGVFTKLAIEVAPIVTLFAKTLTDGVSGSNNLSISMQELAVSIALAAEEAGGLASALAKAFNKAQILGLKATKGLAHIPKAIVPMIEKLDPTVDVAELKAAGNDAETVYAQLIDSINLKIDELENKPGIVTRLADSFKQFTQDLSRGLQDLPNEVNRARELAAAGEARSAQAAAELDPQIEAIDKEIAALEELIKTREAARDVQAANDAFLQEGIRRGNEAYKESLNLWKQQADQIKESTRTPMERFGKDINEALKLFNTFDQAGKRVLDRDTLKRLVKQRSASLAQQLDVAGRDSGSARVIETARLSLQAASDSGQKKGESQEDLLKKIFSGTYDGNQVLRELLALLKESA